MVLKLVVDEELFKYFNVNKKEQEYIIEQVEKWTA